MPGFQPVSPAKAGVQMTKRDRSSRDPWAPAFAGETVRT